MSTLLTDGAKASDSQHLVECSDVKNQTQKILWSGRDLETSL